MKSPLTCPCFRRVILLAPIMLLLIASSTLAQNVTTMLKGSWHFRKEANTTWMKATVPGTVHTDLMANNVIPDPFYRDNEDKVQWVAQENWEYETAFDVDKNTFEKKYIELVFEGLDTYADVYLNEQKILSANNMFCTWIVPIRSKAGASNPLLKRTNNKLSIHFLSAEKVVDSIAKAALPLVRPCENNRHYVRKAQYNFGWDWGPKLITCGVWRPIKINAWNDQAISSLEAHNQDLAYSNPAIKAKKAALDIKLIQKPDSIGQSFYFTVNGKPTFIKGANWIPADEFLPRITKAKYRNLLLAAKEANINMFRVWGGGIYEDDYFYDLCDSLGIMVWQDFMFAGAMYPANADFLENIKQEIIDNIKRLHKHPCIAVWCGNNEIDEAWNNWGWQRNFNLSPADTAKLWAEYKKIFHELLPQLVQQYDGRAYITTSPLKGWGRKESMTHADSHYWGVWGAVEPISTYKQKVPRFMSEYGMQAMPNMETIEQYALPADYDTASTVMKVHQKHSSGYKNLGIYLNQNNLKANTFKGYVEATQELQSRALDTAITAHMFSNGRCMGTIFWQFNDCWPVCSWSVVDYYGRKKKAYHTVKRLYATKLK